MDFALNSEQQALKAHVGKIGEKEFAPNELRWERDPDYAKKALKQLGELGLLGLIISQEYGGVGLSHFDALIAIEEMARHSPSASYYMANTSLGQAYYLEAFGSEEMKRRYLPTICRGETVVSIGISEPQAGSAATAMTTKAVKDGGDFVLNGRKHYVSHAGSAQLFVVYARMANGKGASSIGAILLDRDTPGFIVERLTENMAGNFQGDLTFTDCRVPERNLLLGAGAFSKLTRCYNLERCGAAATVLGNATGAFEQALAYVQERRQFNRPIIDFQAVQLKLADTAIRLEGARLLLYQALVRGNGGFPEAKDASMAKIAVVEAGMAATDMAIQLFGAAGYMKETGLERRYRQIRGSAIAGGVLDIHKTMIAGWLSNRRFSQWAKGSADEG